MYVERMGTRKPSTTVRLDRVDLKALERPVPAKYYRGRRSPSTGLFVSDSTKLGDESELFKNLEN
jgi:hypothetical protein